jgi:hypothetical protein
MSYKKEELLSKLQPEVQDAIRTLEARGLVLCTHFGINNAVSTLRQMDAYCQMGCLYEWLKLRYGMDVC